MNARHAACSVDPDLSLGLCPISVYYLAASIFTLSSRNVRMTDDPYPGISHSKELRMDTLPLEVRRNVS